MKKIRSILYTRDLVGLKVKSRDGELLGEIEDLAAEVHTGTIAYAIMRYHEHGKRFMLPYGSLEYDPRERCLIAGVQRSVFENTPGMAEPLSAD